MRRAVLAVVAALLTSLPASAQVLRPQPTPAVVELFTAQGCSACPQANVWAAQLANRQNVIVLTYPVDYWDYLGWKDTLAKPAYAMRQRGYRTKLGLKDVYTPQFIIDGRREAAGNKLSRVLQALGQSRTVIGPEISFDPAARRAFVRGGQELRGGAEAWLIRYDPRILSVPVRTGENRGVNVLHRNTVRELVRLGSWTGRPRSYSLPPPSAPGLRTVVVLQSLRRDGVIGAARHPVR
jgi:hypothetical protein